MGSMGTGGLGDWETGGLGDWETGGLGDWECGECGEIGYWKLIPRYQLSTNSICSIIFSHHREQDCFAHNLEI